MSKSLLFLTVGVIGIVTLILARIWFWDGKSKEPNKPEFSTNQTTGSFSNVVGQKAPNFTLPDIEGREVTLRDLSGQNVVLFFAEGFMCYPCIAQLVALSIDERLNNNEIVFYGIVIDSWENWRRSFRNPSAIKVLFDFERRVSRLYDTLNLPSSMHKGLENGHTYFIIDRQGVIRFALDDPSMGLRNEQLVQEIGKIEHQE